MGAYLATPEWRAALQIDGRTPPGARGPRWEWTITSPGTYLLYPRLIYPQSKDSVAGTWKPWRRWDSPEDVPWQRLGLAFWISDRAFGLFPKQIH